MSSPLTHFKKDENMQNKNTLKLEPHSIDHEGRALARDPNNRVVLIENALPQSQVLVEIKETKKNYALAQSLEILKASPFMIEAKCPHAQRQAKEKCGGCTWQDLDYTKQLEYKKQILVDALTRIGKISKENELLNFEVNPSKYQFNYRNKMEFAFSQDLSGALVLGLKSAKSHEVIEVDCVLCHALINKVMHRLNFLCNEENLPIYSDNKGYLRYVNTRTSTQKGKIKDFLIEIISYPNAQYNSKLYEICRTIQNEFPEITGIVHSIRKNSLNIAYGETIVATFGKNYLTENLKIQNFDITLKHSSQSFFQVNSFACEDLYTAIVNIALSLDIKNICDIYCGVGGIGIAITKAFSLAKRPYNLFGLELMKGAIKLAEENAKNAGIEAVFTLSNANRLGQFLKACKKLDLIILDPPRAGIDKKSIDILKQANIPYILLVSCNPASLARDIALLQNYEIKKIEAYDLFPHTSHVESVCLLRKII